MLHYVQDPCKLKPDKTPARVWRHAKCAKCSYKCGGIGYLLGEEELVT